MALSVTACATPTVSPSSSPAVSPVGVETSTATPSGPTASTPTIPATSAAPPCADLALAALSGDQRIGQLFLMGLADDMLGPAELDAIRSQHVGSVWFTTTTSIGVAGVRRIADSVQAQATEATTGGVGFFIAANQEGGLIQALTGPGFDPIPSALAQGGLSPQTLEKDALAWGHQLGAAGVNLDFGPVFDVVPPGTEETNAPIGHLRREYGHDPIDAGRHAVAFMRGMTQAGVATTAKHFPGLGRVVSNTDFAAGVVDRTTTRTAPSLEAFRMGIAAGVPFVMVALARYAKIDPDQIAAFSPVVIGDLLRHDLGFEGVVMSDDLGATAAVKSVPVGDRAVDFVLAGGDLVVSKTAAATVAMVAAVKARVAADPAFAQRVDEAALRVLAAKQAAGLLECPG